MLLVDFGVPELVQKVKAKAKVFRYVSSSLYRRGTINPEVILEDRDGEGTSQAYWLLNLAYKHQELEDGVLTNEEKRAAIQACAVMAVRPFVAPDPENVTKDRDNYANQVLAFSWGAAVIREPRLRPTQNEREMLYTNLMRIRFPSLGSFIRERNLGRAQLKYKIELSDEELLAIDVIILQFEAMARAVSCLVRRTAAGQYFQGLAH